MPPKAAPEPKSTKKPRTTAKAAQPKAKAPRKPKAPPKPMGRPSDYTPELCDRICAELAAGLSMRTVCKPDDMPSAVTVFAWLRKHPDFLKQYEVAKSESADALVEEMLDIADDGRNDWMEVHDREGDCVGYRVNGEHIQRSRLRVDTRKWSASKLKPKKYGDKVDVSHGVEKGDPILTLFNQTVGKVLRPVVE